MSRLHRGRVIPAAALALVLAAVAAPSSGAQSAGCPPGTDPSIVYCVPPNSGVASATGSETADGKSIALAVGCVPTHVGNCTTTFEFDKASVVPIFAVASGTESTPPGQNRLALFPLTPRGKIALDAFRSLNTDVYFVGRNASGALIKQLVAHVHVTAYPRKSRCRHVTYFAHVGQPGHKHKVKRHAIVCPKKHKKHGKTKHHAKKR